MSPSRAVSVQELLAHLDAIKNADTPQAANAIRDNLQELGIYDLLLAAEQKYKMFWDCLGDIKVIETLEQIDLDSQEFNSDEGKELFSLESKPYLNKQSKEFKAFAAWHLHNTQLGFNDSVFTSGQLKGMVARSYSILENEIDSEPLANQELIGEGLQVAVRNGMQRLLDVIEILRVLDVEMPAQVISSFLYVASCHDGCTSAELQEKTGLSRASTSRNSDWLTGMHRSNPKRGLNLITKEVYGPNRRLRYFKLTREGRKLAKELYIQLNS